MPSALQHADLPEWDAVLVGGTAAAVHAAHRPSIDAAPAMQREETR